MNIFLRSGQATDQSKEPSLRKKIHSRKPPGLLKRGATCIEDVRSIENVSEQWPFVAYRGKKDVSQAANSGHHNQSKKIIGKSDRCERKSIPLVCVGQKRGEEQKKGRGGKMSRLSTA